MMWNIKVQPIQPVSELPDKLEKCEPLKHAGAGRSRFVRLIPSVLLRTSSSEKVCANEEFQLFKDGSNEFEPSSVCLAKMVQNFLEDSNGNSDDRMHSNAIPVRCGRRRCKCFNGQVDDDDDYDDSSDDEPDCFGGCFGDSNHSSSLDACDILKTLIPCSSVVERNLLADTARIVEKNKICKQRGEGCRKFVADGLMSLGYVASICQSRWERTSSFPAGEYEYIDVVYDGERLLIDIDFRSEFEIARPTKTYKTILQTLQAIFVGKPDRLEKIISTVTDAAKQSLKKKGLHFPPWRKAEYVKLKWLAPYNRVTPTPEPPTSATHTNSNTVTPTLDSKPTSFNTATDSELPMAYKADCMVFPVPEVDEAKAAVTTSTDTTHAGTKEWTPKPPLKSKTGVKVVTGLASIMKD